jgi:hypothetical protein
MTHLAKRRGTAHQDLLVDTGNRQLRLIFRKLSRHYTHGESMQEEELIVAVAEFLNKVRNNIFHGVKVYDDKADLDLLGTLNPVLLAIFKAAEGV